MEPNLNDVYPTPNNNLVLDNNEENNVPVQTKSSKKPIPMIIVGVLVLVCIIGGIFLFKLLGTDYKNIYEQKILVENYLHGAITYCGEVRKQSTNKFNEGYIDFDDLVSKCKDETGSLYKELEQLEQNGITNDSNLKKLYDDFKIALDTNLPAPEKQDPALEAYTALYNLTLALGKESQDSISIGFGADESAKTKFNNAIKYFVDSDTKELSEFGKELSQLHENAWEKWIAFEKSYTGVDPSVNSHDVFEEAHEEYNKAVKEFFDYSTNNLPDFTELFVLANDDNGEITNFSNALWGAIEAKL